MKVRTTQITIAGIPITLEFVFSSVVHRYNEYTDMLAEVHADHPILERLFRLGFAATRYYRRLLRSLGRQQNSPIWEEYRTRIYEEVIFFVLENPHVLEGELSPEQVREFSNLIQRRLYRWMRELGFAYRRLGGWRNPYGYGYETKQEV